MSGARSWQITVCPVPSKRSVATGDGDSRVAHPKVSVLFDDDIFLALRKRAVAEGTSFAEQVRKALRRGIST